MAKFYLAQINEIGFAKVAFVVVVAVVVVVVVIVVSCMSNLIHPSRNNHHTTPTFLKAYNLQTGKRGRNKLGKKKK